MLKPIRLPLAILVCLPILAPPLDAGPFGRGPRGGRDRDRNRGGERRNDPRGNVPADLQRRIDDAIEKGREALLGMLTRGNPAGAPPPGGSHLSVEALCALALLRSGTSPTEDAIQRVWNRVKGDTSGQVYQLGIGLMLAEAMLNPIEDAEPLPRNGQEEVRGWVARAADQLASGCNAGTWSYSVSNTPPGVTRATRIPGGAIGSAALVAEAERIQDYGGQAGSYNYSTAQYAILGLKAASLCGHRPPEADKLWRLVAQQFITGQATEGGAVQVEGTIGEGSIDRYVVGRGRARGWHYCGTWGKQWGGYGSMTACGVAGLIVARSEITDLSAAEERAIDDTVLDGIGWIQEHFVSERNPCERDDGNFGKPNIAWLGDMTYYWLYSIERAGVFANLSAFGDRAWYLEGAEFLVGEQQGDGTWPLPPRGRNEPVPVRTAFAVLFLAKGTAPEYAGYSVGSD